MMKQPTTEKHRQSYYRELYRTLVVYHHLIEQATNMVGDMARIMHTGTTGPSDPRWEQIEKIRAVEDRVPFLACEEQLRKMCQLMQPLLAESEPDLFGSDGEAQSND